MENCSVSLSGPDTSSLAGLDFIIRANPNNMRANPAIVDVNPK
ncbi:MAG: hypothetical protein ACHQ1H_01615 [Nitrososphaerales archaeon]